MLGELSRLLLDAGAVLFSLVVTGQHQGLEMVYGMIQSQSWLFAYKDLYRPLAIIALFCAPWCPLLDRVGRAAKSDAVMH